MAGLAAVVVALDVEHDAAAVVLAVAHAAAAAVVVLAVAAEVAVEVAVAPAAVLPAVSARFLDVCPDVADATVADVADVEVVATFHADVSRQISSSAVASGRVAHSAASASLCNCHYLRDALD